MGLEGLVPDVKSRQNLIWSGYVLSFYWKTI